MYNFNYGNVNVSQLGNEYYGCGGYIDICHAAKTIIFVGSFTAKKLKVNNLKSGVNIENEGKILKAVNNVKEITFSSKKNTSQFYVKLKFICN